LINLKANQIVSPLPPFSTIIIFIIMVIVGLAIVPFLPIQLEPAQATRSISVEFTWPKTSPSTVEHEVTAKLEGVLGTVRGVKSIRSISSEGSGYVEAEIEDKVNINECRYEISTLVRQIYPGLPVTVSYPGVYIKQAMGSGNKSILSYTITTKGNPFAMQQFAEKIIKPRLALVKGVDEIRLSGSREFAWEIQYSPAVLFKYDISTAELTTRINDFFGQYALGKCFLTDSLISPSPEYSYLTLRANKSDSIDWHKIPIKNYNNKLLFLTDIANVNFVAQEPESFYRINGNNTLNLDVVAGKNTNYISLANEIKDKVADIQSHMPRDFTVTLAYDSSEYLIMELGKTVKRFIVTLGILFVFVLLISRQKRYLWLIVISLISNLLIAFVLYYVFKIELHLYAIAGITISIGILIDNTIVVIDHIRQKGNLRILQAVAGSTFTFIGSVCIVFLMNETQQVKLLDFAWVVIINLIISFFISLFFIPALLTRVSLKSPGPTKLYYKKRQIVRWNWIYFKFIGMSLRFRKKIFLFAILAFGLPVFMLPLKIDKGDQWAKIYNLTLGSPFYNESIRSWADKLLGGTVRLFISNNEHYAYTNSALQRQSITINISMPQGATVERMDELVLAWERYLKRFDQIAQFQTRVSSGTGAVIKIFFKDGAISEGFPNKLKAHLEDKAVKTGFAVFNISGVGQGFQNSLLTKGTDHGITLLGYNYQKLYRYAEQVKDLLAKNPRIEKISIESDREYDGEVKNYGYVLNIKNDEKFLINKLALSGVNNAVARFSSGKSLIGNIFSNKNYIPVLLKSSSTANVWEIMNESIKTDSNTYVHLNEFSEVNKEKSDDEILRNNQQYQLVVNYNFLGDDEAGYRLSGQIVKQISSSLPVGYRVKNGSESPWWENRANFIWPILITILIVFIICSTLLNNVSQALSIIVLIPISYIGVFLITSIYKINFDEGGYAAFIILCGIVVSAALYILNDYNNLSKDFPQKPPIVLFLKAFNTKIIPVIISRFSIIISLIPVIIYSDDEPFWFPLAICVLGGVLFSIIVLLIFLPLSLKGINNLSKSLK
jgi:multidrug efflux pump subunit AcrB